MEDGTFFKISLFRFRRASELPNSSSCLDPIVESDSVPVFPWSLGPSAKRLAFLTYVLIAASRFHSILQAPDVFIVSQRRHPQVCPQDSFRRHQTGQWCHHPNHKEPEGPEGSPKSSREAPKWPSIDQQAASKIATY